MQRRIIPILSFAKGRVSCLRVLRDHIRVSLPVAPKLARYVVVQLFKSCIYCYCRNSSPLHLVPKATAAIRTLRNRCHHGCSRTYSVDIHARSSCYCLVQPLRVRFGRTLPEGCPYPLAHASSRGDQNWRDVWLEMIELKGDSANIMHGLTGNFLSEGHQRQPSFGA